MIADSPSFPSSTGLCDLVNLWTGSAQSNLESRWRDRFSAAAEQLEIDDLIDSRLTDMMADCLAEAEEALDSGYDFRPALNRLCSLYHRNLESVPLETVWRRKAAHLGAVQLNSSSWGGLHAALDGAIRGELVKVAGWLEQMEEYFLNCWDNYENSDILESEITTESVLCHRFLQEGIELWLEALAEFRDGLQTQSLCRTKVLALAEEGQRYLVVVQLLEDELERQMSQVLAWART